MAKQPTKSKNDKSDFLQKLKKAAGTKNADIMADYDEVQPIDFISTGNFLFNALISADVKKGVPSGKILTLAGPAGCGKTFTALEIMKNAQAMGYTAVMYDTEMANNDKTVLEARGINTSDLLYIPIDTVENLKTSMINLLDSITNEKVIIVIDSLGNLSTDKEMRDSTEGAGTKDMTRASVLKALFRTVTMKAGLKQVPIICINHTYTAVASFVPMQIVGGGSGPMYMSSIIVQFTKAQDKNASGVFGAVITAKTDKCRFAKEKMKVKFTINFNTGMNPYSGLLGFCEEEGIITTAGEKMTKEQKKEMSKEEQKKWKEENSAGYLYNGAKYTARQLDKAFWDKELDGFLGSYIKNRFQYSGSTAGLDLEMDDSSMDDEDSNVAD